jgi:PAS domain S-box-containing protein
VDSAIYTMDLTGRITRWNKGVEWVKGYTEEEFIGRNFAMAFTDEDRAAGRSARWTRPPETARTGGRVAAPQGPLRGRSTAPHL